MKKTYIRISGRHAFAIFFSNSCQKNRRKSRKSSRRGSRRKQKRRQNLVQKLKSAFQKKVKEARRQRIKSERKKRWRKRLEASSQAVTTVGRAFQKVIDWIIKFLGDSTTILLRLAQITLIYALLKQGNVKELENGWKYMKVGTEREIVTNHENIA